MTPPAQAGTAAAPPTAAAAEERAALDRSLVHGIAWTSAVRWSGQAATWVATGVVAHLLSREDYGLLAMAGVFLGVVTLLSEFGLGTAVVAMRELSRREVAQLNGLAVLLGLAACGVTASAAVPLGRFFDAPLLPPVVVAMSFGFVLAAFKVVPLGLLQRDLRFRDVALVDGAQALLVAGTMVVLAMLGFRYWTLVIGGLLGTAVAAAATFALRPHPFAWPRLRTVRAAVGFSGQVAGSRLAWYAYSNADFLVAGKVLGKGALGAYSLAWMLASIPVEKVSAMVGSVTPAFFSAVQKDRAGLRRYLLTLTEALSLVTFPAAVGLAVVADDLALTLGPQWEPAIVPLRILAAYAAFRSITPLLSHLLTMTGEARFVMWVNVGAMLTLPLAFWGGSRWGPAGIAAAWVAVYPFVTLPLYVRVFRRTSTRPAAYLGAVWPALSATALMALAVTALDGALPAGWPPGARLALQVLCGAAAYPLVLLALHRRRVAEMVGFVRSLRAARS